MNVLPYSRNHALHALKAMDGPRSPVLRFDKESLAIGRLVIEEIPDDHTLRFVTHSELGYHSRSHAFDGRLLILDNDPSIQTHIKQLLDDNGARTSRIAEV